MTAVVTIRFLWVGNTYGDWHNIFLQKHVYESKQNIKIWWTVPLNWSGFVYNPNKNIFYCHLSSKNVKLDQNCLRAYKNEDNTRQKDENSKQKPHHLWKTDTNKSESD